MAGIKYKAQDYIYGSVRVSAIEKNAVGNERLFRAAEAKSYEEAVHILEECGIKLDVNIEIGIASLLSSAYDVLDGLAPNPELFRVLRYPYDCHNIKAAIKSSVMNRSYDELLFDCGSVALNVLKNAVREREFAPLPENMADAAMDALEGYYRNSDPQRIDFLLDRACYKDMTACAEEYGVKFFIRYVEHKADSTNILSAIRLVRMGAPVSFMKNVYLDGGRITFAELAECFEGENSRAREEQIFAKSKKFDYKLKAAIGDSLTDIEKACDMLTLDFVEEAAGDSLAGAELLTNFVLRRETEAKNVRIVLSGKLADLDPEIIRSRLRV